MSQRHALCAHEKSEPVAKPTQEVQREQSGKERVYTVEHLRCLRCGSLFSRERPAKGEAA
jgi:hypothetical protein